MCSTLLHLVTPYYADLLRPPRPEPPGHPAQRGRARCVLAAPPQLRYALAVPQPAVGMSIIHRQHRGVCSPLPASRVQQVIYRIRGQKQGTN